MKRILSLILVLVLVLGSMPLAFADNHEMTDGEKLAELGLVEGYQGDLMEDKTFTRAELAVMLARLNGEEENAEGMMISTFTDISFDEEDEDFHWAAPYIGYSEVKGWMDGVGQNMFDPDGIVTGQMVATTMLRVLGHEPEWETATQEAQALGIIDDNPGDAYTRASAFDMMLDTVNTPMADGTMTLGQKLGIVEMEEEEVVEDVAIDSAVALNSTVVEVSLEEAAELIDETVFTVTDEDDAVLEVLSAEFAGWDADNETVLVTLAEDTTSGALYTVASGDTEAEFGGMDEDEDAPDNVTVDTSENDPYEITLEFDEAVAIDTLVVEIEENISGDELVVLDMAYDGSDKIVLTTDAQSKSLYNAKVTAIEDLAGNANEDDLEDSFIGKEVPDADLKVTRAEKDGYAAAIITFSEKVNADTVDPTNFTVTENISDDEVVVLTAEVDEDDETKVNITLEDTKKELYNVEVNDVEDKYGNELDSDANEESFIGEAMPDEDFSYTLSVESNTEVKVLFKNKMDKDLAEDVANYAIEENISGDELVVLTAELDEDDEKTVTLTTESMSKELYNITVTNVMDIYENDIDTDANEKSFIGQKVADEISAIKSISSVSDRKLTITFDQNVGDNVTRISNYSIDEGIGYPNKVEKDANNSKAVVLTLPKTYNDTVYTVTVSGLENSDGIMMDADEELTETFVGELEPSAADEVNLKGAAAVNKLVLNLYFDEKVEDIAGLITSDDLDTTTLQDGAVVVDGTDLEDFAHYAYVGDNEKVLTIAIDKDAGFDFSSDGDVTIDASGVDGTETAQLVGDDSDPKDLEIRGVYALDESTIKVYFNQTVRNLDPAGNAVVEHDDQADIALTANTKANADETQWTIKLDGAMENEDSYTFNVTNLAFANTHSATVEIAVLDLTVDETFAGDTTTADYTDGVKAVDMTDEKTVKVYFEEAMDETAVTTSAAYTFYDDSDKTTDLEASIGKIDYDEDTYVATIQIKDTFGEVDSVYLKVDENLSNELGTKVLAEDEVLKQLVTDDTAAAEVAIDDVAVNTSGDTITVTLDQDVTGVGNDDFTISINNGDKLTSDDFVVTRGEDDEVIFTLNSEVVEENESVKVEATESATLEGSFNGEGLDEDTSMVIVK